MNLFVPDRLRKTVEETGGHARRWLEELPDLVRRLVRDWSLTLEESFDHDGWTAWVNPVRLADGTPAMLKVGIPFDDTRYEAEALRAWNGAGTVRLLRVTDDGYSMLLERCLPGTSLWAPGERAGNTQAVAMLPQFWLRPAEEAPFRRLPDVVDLWCGRAPKACAAMGYEAELVEEGLAVARRLAASQPAEVLLHGDFHPGNVLAAQRQRWLAIDPQPAVGDPAFDMAQWLGNRCWRAEPSPDPVASVRRQAEEMSAALGLHPARAAGWAFAKAVGEEFGPEPARMLRAVMRAGGEEGVGC